MIKASELRQGNIFEVEGLGNFPILDFSCDFTGNLHQVTFLSRLLYHRDRVPSETIETIIPELWQIKPIPLTPEILEKCGFKFNHYAYTYDLAEVSLSQNEFEPVVWVEGRRLEIGRPIKSVHQLQNLYFALTGEELIV